MLRRLRIPVQGPPADAVGGGLGPIGRCPNLRNVDQDISRLEVGTAQCAVQS